MNQARLLDATTNVQAVIYLDMGEDQAVSRLGSRLTCARCGEIYGAARQPEREGICDRCAGGLYQRADESDFAIRRRLELFNNETRPLLQHYRHRKLLHEINASQAIEKVFEDISLIVQNLE
jgi:adenylate kinase